MKINGLILGVACLFVGVGTLSAEENGAAASFAKLANEAFHQGDYKKAVRNWEKAAHLDSTNATYRESLGIAYERQAEISSFPVLLTGKARQSFVRALELQPDNLGAMRGLIDLAQQPIGLCEGDLNEASRLIERLEQVDPDAGKREREYWLDAKRESQRPGQKVLCAPVKVSRVLTDHLIPNTALRASTPPKPGDAVASKEPPFVLSNGTK